MVWNLESRKEVLASLHEKEYDLIIIGGGITGAGILLDASARGLKAIVIEKEDFASGTSSRSTKLIHGGLRYLKNLEFRIVKETGQERAIAYNNAPHLVVPEKMVLPIQKGGSYGKFMTSVALYVYDWLAGVEKSERRKMLNKEETLKIEPLLKPDILKGSGFYSEYRTDDARLTLEIIKTAIHRDGVALNYLEAEKLQYDSEGQANGVDCIDVLSGEKYSIKGKVIVNACGPWSDEIRTMDKSMNNKRLHLTKGVHIVIKREKLPLAHSVYFDVAGGRMIFAIPRGGVTYVGTTETNYSERKENPNVTLADVNYLLDATNNMFPSANVQLLDVESSWAGLRPLIHEEGKSPSELSRKDEIFLSPKGMITIAGGKLTGYRVMAKKVLDIACKRLDIAAKCTTENIRINGYAEAGMLSEIQKGLDEIGIKTSPFTASRLLHRYGSQTFSICKNYKEENFTSLIEAEAHFTMKHELTLTLLDFFVRRTGYMYFSINTVVKNVEIIGQVFANHYNWSAERLKNEIESVKEEIKNRSQFN
jgi:glycerol-3-phosphate dehydrogenase